jgi:hypothetical protein
MKVPPFEIWVKLGTESHTQTKTHSSYALQSPFPVFAIYLTLMVTHDWLFAGLVSLTLLTVAQFLIALPADAFTVALMVKVPIYPGGKVSPGPPQLASPV